MLLELIDLVPDLGCLYRILVAPDLGCTGSWLYRNSRILLDSADKAWTRYFLLSRRYSDVP